MRESITSVDVKKSKFIACKRNRGGPIVFKDISLDEESIISDGDNLNEKADLAQQEDVFEQR